MLDHYRHELLAFQEALGREYFLHYSGQKLDLQLQPIYERYADLFTLDVISRLNQLYDSTPAYLQRQRWGIKLLRAWAEEQFLQQSVRDLTEQLAEAEVRTTLQYDDQEIPFPQVLKVLATEPDPHKRRQLNQQRLHQLESHNLWRQERLQKLQQGSRTLGYENYWTMATSWRDSHLSEYANQFARFLQDTEELYFEQLRQRFPHLVGLPLKQAERADVEYFLQLNQYTSLFPEGSVVQMYGELLRTMGITLDRQPNVEIDDVQRPGKHSRSVCIPIRVPEEIKVSLSLRQGPLDYQLMLREGGRAQHYAWTAATLPAEFKFAGDPAASEGYALLFQYLMLDPRWLDEWLHLSLGQEFITLGWLHKLFHVRRAAAQLHAEQALHTTTGLHEAGQLYAQYLTEATGIRYPAEEFLWELEDGVYVAHRLRAWLFEVQLREHLRTRFGTRWWQSKKAAGLLIELWDTGQEYTVEELASQADLGPLFLDHLVNEFMEALKS